VNRKEARRAENQAAWAAGKTFRRWSSGSRPSTASHVRTGPPSYETGRAERQAIKDARSEANRRAHAALAVEARQQREASREAARSSRRAEDRRRAAQWHQGRRDDLLAGGGDLAVLLAADLAASSE
jgi:hypothetical protein